MAGEHLSLLPPLGDSLFAAAGAVDEPLSSEELARYSSEGWLGPYPLLSAQGVELASRLNDENASRFTPPASQGDLTRRGVLERRPWFKSMHSLLPQYYDIVSSASIVGKLRQLMGQDLLCWGSSVTVRKPGQKHRWHVDVEHRRWPGATIFMGLRGMNPQSSLKVISRSHLIEAVPQELSVSSDELALAAARRWQPESQLVNVDMNEGEYFIFHGRLWHGSENTGSGTRLALLSQYSPASAKVEIPLSWNEPIRWLDGKPPCILLSGHAPDGLNRLIERPRG